MSLVEPSIEKTAAGGLALPWGMRALAEESPGAMSDALVRLADRLERGETWQNVLEDPGLRLPSHVRGLLRAGLQTQHVPLALEQLVHLQRRSLQLRREMWLSVAYPLTVMVSLGVLFTCFEFFVVAELARMYENMYTDYSIRTPIGLPAMTQLMVDWSGPPAIALLLSIVTVGILLPAAWSLWRPLWLDILANRLPILGPLWLWAGMVDFCRLLALLLQAGVALPEALRCVSDGLRSSELAAATRRLAKQVEGGRSLGDAIAVTSPLPDTLGPVAEWGETRSALPAALEAAAQMYEGRVRMQLSFVRLFLPPCVFLFAGGVILLSLLAIFLPMIQLVSALT